MHATLFGLRPKKSETIRQKNMKRAKVFHKCKNVSISSGFFQDLPSFCNSAQFFEKERGFSRKCKYLEDAECFGKAHSFQENGRIFQKAPIF
jgi:hypothetical protein